MIKKPRKKPADIEHKIQAEFISLINYYSKNGYPLLDAIYSIPNEGKRSPHVANQLKAAGMKSGVPDLCLPFPNGKHAGLYLEFKTPDEYRGKKIKAGVVSDNQRKRMELLKLLKNRCEVVRSVHDALRVVSDHTGYHLPYFEITKGI